VARLVSWKKERESVRGRREAEVAKVSGVEYVSVQWEVSVCEGLTVSNAVVRPAPKGDMRRQRYWGSSGEISR
jgi:hypothetical protein